MHYLDFDLLIDHSKTGFKVQVLATPAGVERASGEFTLPFDQKDIKIFLLSIGHPRRGVRRIESSQTDEAKKFGGRLFDAVFAGDVWSCWRRSLDACRQQEAGLRIRLQIAKDAQSLADLPWEYLYDARLNRFLALSAETPVTRYLALSEPVRPQAIRLPLRILVMIASPAGYPALDVELEWRNLQESLEDLRRAGLVVAERLETATLTHLQRRLRRGEFHIFHFIGHGGFDEATQDGMLLLEDRVGRGRAVSGQDLGTLLRDHRPLRLAIINACEGARASHSDPFAGIAQSLVQQGIPAVIAMQFEISDEAAIAFSHEFYGAVADGYPVDAALGEARKAVYARTTDVEWGTPVLFMHSQDGRIFEISASLASHATAEPINLRSEVEDATPGLERDPAGQPGTGRSEPAPRRASLPDVDEWYTQALEYFYTEQWPETIDLLSDIVALQPEYPGAGAKLDYARRRQRLADLYEEARRLASVQDWQNVVKLLDRISEQDATYPDPQGLLHVAQESLSAQQREQKLATQYGQAVRDFDAGRLDEALAAFEAVMQLAPDYKQTEVLLTRVRTAISKREVEGQHALLVAELSARVSAMAAAHDWDGAERAFDDLSSAGASQAALETRRVEIEQERRLEAQQRAEQFAGALLHFDAGRWQDSIAAFQALLRADSDHADPIRGTASDLLLQARKELEAAQLPPPPAGRRVRPTDSPEEPQASQQPENYPPVRRPATRPHDLPK